MSEDEGPDSDSSGREFRRRIMRPRSRRSKEARVCYSSRTTMSLQDPMPEYVDPELVKLIAQNAPFELDVFMRSFHKSSTKRRAESGGRRDGAAKEGERRPLAVEALLSSMRERNDHLSIRKGGQDIRHSCPEGIWSDYDETDENICRATAVKRKRPKSVDSARLPPSDRQCPSEVSFRVSDNKGRGKLRRANVSTKANVSTNTSDEGSNCLEDECRPPVKTDTFDVSSTPARLPVGNDCDMLSAKPWRHGMRKGKRSAKDERQANASCCKRKAETDSRKTSEVRKYMETKMVERRKEQQQLKAEADAALAARKEQQRKLDLHQQSMFQSQGTGAKSRGHSPRPAWVFEYTSLREPPRPWSSSSGELNTYLPPPVTPPTLEPVPLDLYATQLQFAEGRSSTPKVDAIQVQNAHARENRRSKKARGCSREVQRQLKYGRSRLMKEFPHTDLELAKLVNSPVSRKARWKAKSKLRERKVSCEEVFQRQLFDHDEPYSQRRSGDLEVYKRSLKRQLYSNGGSLCTAAKELPPQKSTSKFSTKTATKPMRPAESSLKSVTKDQARSVTKVKRLKATEHFIPGKVKELTGEELASLLNANRVPSDCERETNVTLNGQVLAERMIVGPSQTSPASEQESITDLRNCVDHSLGSPQKNSTDEDILCKWFGPSVESSEQHVIGADVLRENTGQMLGSLFMPSKNNRAQLQVLDVKKEKTGDTDIVSATSKNPTMVVRWQRMQLLKNLAEQLVQRVDEACAKKRQIEHSAVEKINSPSMDINIEPSGQPTGESGHKADSLEPKLQVDHQSNLNNGLPSIHLAGSLLGEKFQDSEPKFFHQSKQNNIINYRGLTEQEQAGFVSRSVKTDEMKSKTKNVITSPRRASITEAADYKAVGGPISEVCTMMEWTTSDKCTDITCNNASASSSFGPSSTSTASSSPVVLPTSTKYHMRRIKHSKMVSREAKTRQPKKEDWIIPAENDTHSIFNVYTQHLKDREKLAVSTLNNLDNSATDETEIDPGIAGPAAEDEISNVSSTPLSRKFTISESLLKLSEPMNVQRTRSADCSHESTESPVSDGTGPDLQKKHNVSSPNFGSLQKRESRADKSAARPPPDLTNLKTNAIELAGLDPEWTILEIGDLKVCQSPTSIHLRLDRCQDNGEDRKAKEKKFVNTSHGPNVGNCTEASTNTSVGSKHETGGQCMRNLISPMKVTYARRVHSRARPDDGCTDDERVVVEWHQMNGEVPPVASQGDTKLDASEQAPTGLTCPRQNKVIGNAQSEIVETHAVKHILVNEKDSKEAYLCNKAKADGASEPIIDCASEKKLQACDGETRALCTMLTCQKRELSIQLNRNSKLDPQVEFRDSEEWELKLRRDQLEAELKKLDAEIMKTRAKLHQRQPMIDSQAHRVSSISLTDHPVEGAFKLDKVSNIQKRFAKYMAINDKHNDVFEESDDLQMQTIPGTHFSLKSIKDGEKTVTTSNSYSDSFISEETEVGQKILGTGKRDCLVDHLRSTENIDVYSRSLRELKTGSQQFETVLENRPQGSQSNASKKEAEVQSNCKMPRTQDEFASEGSEISTGGGPGRKLDKPPEVDCDESTARCRISIVRPVPDQMVEIDVRATRLCAKDERTTLQCQTVCSNDELVDAVLDLVNANEKSGEGPWTPLHSNPPQTEEKVVRRNEGQTSFEQKGRNAQALPGYGAGESPSSVVQCGAQNADNSKGLTPGGGDHKSAVTADMEILPGNRTPPGIKQNGWLMKGERGNRQSGAFEQAEAQSQCKMLSTQDQLAVEGSDISNGRAPRRLHKPPEADFDGSPARHRTSKVRPVPDQMVEIDVGGGRLFGKDERTMLQSHTGCSRDGRLDAVHNLLNAEEISGRGPWVPLPCIPQHTEDMVIRKNKGQTCLRQKGRKAQELAEYGAGESPSSVVQRGAQNSDNSKALIPGGRDDMSAVKAGVEILPGNGTSPCIQQNGRLLKGEKGNATTCDFVEVPRGPIDEQTEGRISHAAVPSTLLWSARTSEDGSERVPSIELSKLSQKIQDELGSRKQTLACFQNAKTLLLAEDSSRMVTTEGLPFPLPPLGESEECIPLVPSLHHGMQTSHTPVELPAEKRFQSNTGLSNEENGQMTVNDGGNHPTCSHVGKMRDKAATTVPQFIHAACLTPLNIPCGSTAEEAPWECLSLPSHMDFSTIREKLRNNKIATDEYPITDGWSVNSQNKSFDSPTSTTGGESSGGHTLVSESIMTSDVPLNSKDFPEISSLEFGQAAKSKCSPEMDATQENSFLTLLRRPESTNIKTDPSNDFIGTQGLITPVCSTRELPSFLPSLYFHQQTTKTNVSEEVDSIISEDIEHYESDVEEESQNDVEGPASGNFGTTCTSPPPSNDFTSPKPDSGCCVGDRSLSVQVFHPESGLSVTNGPTYIIDHVHKCNPSDCIDQDLTGEVPCWASGMGSPSTLSPRCPESPLSLHAGGQKKSLALTCASPESSGGEAVGCMQSVRATRAEDSSSLQGNSRISDNYYCGSEVSESHHQSESISEELPLVDSEISSNGSGPARENIHSIDTIELNNREDINEVGTRDDGTNLHCNAMACSAPSNPDFMNNTDKQHPDSIGDIPTAAGIAKQNPDMNFLSTSCVVTANFQERARREDNSRCHPVQFASHHESETSKPVELPFSLVLPPLRPSKHVKQYDGTHFSDALRNGKLSTKETNFEETLSNEEHLSTKMSELQLESAHTVALTGTLSAASLAPISSPGVMVKTLHDIFRCEQNNPGTVCTLDVARVEGYEIPVPRILDVEVICLSSHQVGPLQVSDANFSVDPAKVDCNSEDSVIEELEEFGQLRSETYNSSKKFTGGDSSLGHQNINMGDEVIDSAIAVPSLNISGYAGLALEKVPHQDDESLIVSIPLDCASLCAPTCRANDTPDSCFYLTSMGNENQPLGERRITKIESNKSFYCFNGEKSIGGPPTSMHLMMRANRDVSSLPKTEDGNGPQNISLRPDQIISLQSCQANTFNRPSPLFGHQKIVTDLDKDAENHAQDKAENGQVNLQYAKTNAEFEGHADQPYSDACSLQVLQTNFPAQHDSISDSNCSNKEGFVSQSLEQISRNGLSGGVFEATVAVDLEACSSESCSSNRGSLIFMEEKEEVKCCEILEGVVKSGSYQVSCSGTFEDQMQSTTCLTPPHEASSCANASPKLDVRMQKDVNRAEKLDIMTDLVTSLIYEDLLSVELSGLHQEVERIPTSPQISSQTIQTANVTKTVNSKSKRSRKVSEFCQVLKHFLPTGWRSASIRHKKGLFLHVEGLRPHPLNPASKTMPGTLKLNVQYPNYRGTEHFPRTTNTQFLLLDVNDVYSYVQRSFELSSVILDRSPANWYDSMMPVVEDCFSALESQFWETGHIFGNNRWQMHKRLILDLINETLLKQFTTKLLVPSFGMNTLALPVGGENLVQFVTEEIVEHERYASKRGFDIEKVIAKAFEDEHWEKCSEEARDVVGDLAQGILCDLIERFVYEMVRGWGSRINQCQVLAS